MRKDDSDLIPHMTLVPFYNGPWDGLVLKLYAPFPAWARVRAVPPPPDIALGRIQLKVLLLPEVAGGTHMYRRRWTGFDPVYDYRGHE